MVHGGLSGLDSGSGQLNKEVRRGAGTGSVQRRGAEDAEEEEEERKEDINICFNGMFLNSVFSAKLCVLCVSAVKGFWAFLSSFRALNRPLDQWIYARAAPEFIVLFIVLFIAIRNSNYSAR